LPSIIANFFAFSCSSRLCELRVWALLSALIPRLLTLPASPFFSGIFVCWPTVCGLASGLFLFGEGKEFKLEGFDEPIDGGLVGPVLGLLLAADVETELFTFCVDARLCTTGLETALAA
jgi:hypothetical protein